MKKLIALFLVGILCLVSVYSASADSISVSTSLTVSDLPESLNSTADQTKLVSTILKDFCAHTKYTMSDFALSDKCVLAVYALGGDDSMQAYTIWVHVPLKGAKQYLTISALEIAKVDNTSKFSLSYTLTKSKYNAASQASTSRFTAAMIRSVAGSDLEFGKYYGRIGNAMKNYEETHNGMGYIV